jgi:photosystem II stability/assembly factor-like uncharacterized protein
MNRISAPLAILALLACASAAPAQEFLVWRNPKPMGMHLDAVDFPNPRLGVAVGANGGLVRSADGGDSWSVILTPTHSRLRGVDMVDERTGYAAGDHGAIIKTEDGGLTWLSVASPVRYSLLGLRFLSPDTGFISSDYGIILSTRDGGKSWRKDSTVFGSLYGIDFVDRKLGYVVGGQDGGILLRTQNGGDSWDHLPFQGASLRAVGRNLAVGDGRGIAFLPGSEYTPVDIPGQEEFVSVRFLDALRGCITGNRNVSVTLDGGITWRTAPVGTPYWLSDARMLDSATLIAVGSGGVIARSIDQGMTWAHSPDVFRKDVVSLQSLPGGAGYAMAYGPYEGVGLYRTLDDWKTVEHVPFDSNRNIWNVQFLPGGIGFATEDLYGYGDQDALLRTVDRGSTWTPQALPFKDGRVSSPGPVYFLNPDTGFVAEYIQDLGRSGIWKTTDGGGSWKEVLVSAGYGIRRFRFLSPDTGFALQGYILHKTTDGGETWTPLARWGEDGADFDFVDGSHGFVVYEGHVYRTRDGGATWTSSVQAETNYSIESIRFRGAGLGYLVTGSDESGGGILVTRDGGDTWQPAHSGLANPLSTLDISPSGQVFAGGESGAIVTLADKADPPVAGVDPRTGRGKRAGKRPSGFSGPAANGSALDILGRIHRP